MTGVLVATKNKQGRALALRGLGYIGFRVIEAYSFRIIGL